MFINGQITWMSFPCLTDFLRPFFVTLYFENVVSEDSFFSWERSKDSAEEGGRDLARTSTTEFFEMLQEVRLDRLIREQNAIPYLVLKQV